MQLEHVEEETSRQQHGAVTILNAGSTLANSELFQHNKNYHARFELADALVEEVHEKMKKVGKETATAAAKAVEVPSATADGAAAA